MAKNLFIGIIAFVTTLIFLSVIVLMIRVVCDYKVHTLVETPSGTVKIHENITSEKGW